VEHETRARSELAAIVAEALARVSRVSVIPEIHLARMIVAVTEGSDIQTLTDESSDGADHINLGAMAVDALLQHFSVPLPIATGSL
jgi:hypothetical protein